LENSRDCAPESLRIREKPAKPASQPILFSLEKYLSGAEVKTDPLTESDKVFNLLQPAL
jgi:hypothetical protein